MTSTELLTPKECARWRRCSVRKLDRERAEGRGPRYVRIDGRVFYRPTDVDLFISAHVCGGDRGCLGAAVANCSANPPSPPATKNASGATAHAP